MLDKSQKLTEAQSTALAEQLAGFFFDFWERKNTMPSPDSDSEQEK